MCRTITIAPTVKASRADLDGIAQTITDYMECWYGAGHKKLPAAIHPTVVKRVLPAHPDTGKTVLREVTASQLMENALVCAQSGNHPPREAWRNDITIYDVFEDIATAKAVGTLWVDYIHLAKVNGDWKIMHILFDNP